MINLLVAICYCYTALAQPLLPATKQIEVADTYFGVTYKDPYRWLEAIETPEVATGQTRCCPAKCIYLR